MALHLEIPSSPTHNFNFTNSGRSTPYSTTSPSTPKAFGSSELYFLSAPTSPSRASDFYREFEEYSKINHNFTASQPASPGRTETSDDFSFQVNVVSESNFPVSAQELFDGGRIKPSPAGIFKTPTGSPKKKSTTTTTIWEALSPKRKGRRTTSPFESSDLESDHQQVNRGRERITDSSSVSKSRSGRRAARSLSPHREYSSNYQPWVEQKPPPRKSNPPPIEPTKTPESLESLETKSISRRWRLKDFLLFRSASEGRASDKDPLRKYSTLFYRKLDEKNSSSNSSSLRSTDSKDGSTSKRMVSAHEKHYAANKAVSEDRKKKTFLPYKQRILSRFPF